MAGLFALIAPERGHAAGGSAGSSLLKSLAATGIGSGFPRRA